MPKNFYLILLFLSALLLYSCGTSTGSRYATTENEKEKEKETKTATEDANESLPSKLPTEKFDLGSYKGTINAEKPDIAATSPPVEDVWFDYSEDESPSDLSGTMDKLPGYRVQVTTTDNLDEANSTRSDILFRANQKNIYISFDPPFYKVKVGDFTKQSEASELQFKLRQMGYPEARVITDSVNVYR
jgi:hypothetical protein